MATGRLPDPNTAPVTAKGDLYTYSTVPAKLAVGNDGETLVADSAATTGLRWQGSMAAGKNFVINGGFDIWQRGTSSSTNGGYLVADRFNFDSSNCTKSQQTSGAPNGSRYYLRNAFTGASAYATVLHFIETANAAYLWGKTVTFSVKLRRNASMTSNLTLSVAKNATVDAGPGTASWSDISTSTVTNASLPTGSTSADWFTASLTVTIPNDGTANSIRLYVATASTQGSGAQWEMAQAQLEIGSVATEFSRAGGTLAGELAACQRYYVRTTPGVASAVFAQGFCYDTTSGIVVYTPPVPMRVVPTAVEYANLEIKDSSYTGGGTITLSITESGFFPVRLSFASATTLTANRPAILRATSSTSAYLGLTAEL